MSYNALIFVCVSSCTFPLIFVKYNTADHFSVFIFFITKQKKVLKWVLCATSPTPENPLLMTELITLHSIWVIFGFFLCSPTLAMIYQMFISVEVFTAQSTQWGHV